MERFIQEEGLIERICWLIRLRWIAIIGVMLTVLFSNKTLNLSLPPVPLYAIAFTLGIYNKLFSLLLDHVRQDRPSRLFTVANRIANIQISLDLMCLAALIHFSGGVENPFIFYFIFHMIIAGVLLSRRASFLQATFAVLLFASMVTLEYLGALRHYCLDGFLSQSQHHNLTYIVGISFVFITTLYIAVYMATSISAELREREKNLRQLNELLREKDRIKSEYVLRVTHDIKEHLSAIQSCLDPVTQGITGPLIEKQRDLIGRAGQRTEKLMSFVRALLEITRIKLSKDIEMKRFSVRRTIQNAINFVDSQAKDKGMVIECDVEPAVDIITGAEVYIEETVANLLANSVKYTPKDGKIKVGVKDQDGSVLIQIADTGIGIPKGEVSKVFDEFYRASNAKDLEKRGTGLGLAIAKQVVERHKGSIWVESELGKGSTFSIVLPK